MKATMLYGERDIRVEERPEPQLITPTDAIIRLAATCVCGSDLWPYRGIDVFEGPTAIGHEYCGVVEEVGAAVDSIRPGDFVVGSFFASDNTCEICAAGYTTGCVHRQPVLGAQSEYMRVPLADGTLVATPQMPERGLIPSLLAASDVLGTGWFGAVAAQAGPGKTVAVVGDGAVGLMAVLSARQLGAERVIIFSRHPDRQRLAWEFGATEVIETRGTEGVEQLREVTAGLGAHSTIEAVGTQESMIQALKSTRAGGHMSFVGVPHGVSLSGMPLFFSQVHLHGGPAPVRAFLPELIGLILDGSIEPGKVFDFAVPLREAPQAYAAMDERRAIKALLTV